MQVARIVCLVFSGMAVMCGCGPSTPEFGTPPDEVYHLVGAIPDYTRNLKAFSDLFADDAKPTEAQRQAFMKYLFSPLEAKVSDTTATVRVRVLNRADNSPAGEVEWTVEKQEGDWKLKTAPLPQGAPASG